MGDGLDDPVRQAPERQQVCAGRGVRDAFLLEFDVVQRDLATVRLRIEPRPVERIVGDQHELSDIVQQGGRDRLLLAVAVRQDPRRNPRDQHRVPLELVDREAVNAAGGELAERLGRERQRLDRLDPEIDNRVADRGDLAPDAEERGVAELEHLRGDRNVALEHHRHLSRLPPGVRQNLGQLRVDARPGR